MKTHLWFPKRVELAKSIFTSKAGDWHATATELSKRFKQTITAGAVRNMFRDHNIKPSSLVMKSSKIKPQKLNVLELDNISDDEKTVKIAELILKAALENDVDPQDVTWADFRKYTEYYWGQSMKGDDILARHITRVGGYAAIRDSYYPPKTTKFGVEREELRHKSTLHRSVSLLGIRQDLFLKQCEALFARVSPKIDPSKYDVEKRKLLAVTAGRAMKENNVLISDTHLRTLLDPDEGLIKFGPVEECRRLAAIFKQVVEYKVNKDTEIVKRRDGHFDIVEHGNKRTRLNIHLAGDTFAGRIHDMRTGAPIAEQVCATAYEIAQCIRFAAQHYLDIVVRCAVGNHGRDAKRHPQRAVNQKWDSWETVMYYIIKSILLPLPNVQVIIPRAPFFTWESFGMKGFCTHGDGVFSPGSSNTVNLSSLEYQANRLNAKLPDINEYKVVLVGHIHKSINVELDNGTVILVNGAMIPPDDFATTLGIWEAACSQWLWETVPNHMTGDFRRARIDINTDRDSSLDDIAKPFIDF